MSVFKTQKTYTGRSSEAMAVLILLDFKGLTEFAQRAGVARQTVAEALGTACLVNKKRHYLLIQIYEALHTAYTLKRQNLSVGARAYLKDWAKRWRATAVKELLFTESYGRMRSTTTRSGIRQREHNREQKRLSVICALESLKWR